MLLVAALGFFGHRFIESSAQRMEQSLSAEVRPLARLIRLQAHIHRLRVLEMELPHLTDYFAASTQLERLRKEAQAFADELGGFVGEVGAAVEVTALQESWRRYEHDLQAIDAQASAMNMKRVEEISTFESAVRFSSIAQALQDFSATTEQRAQLARDKALAQQEQQRLVFLLLSTGGLLAVAVGFLWFARSLIQRVAVLRDAAQRVADGEAGLAIELSGQDELAELGQVFDVMRLRVLERTRALRESEQRFRDFADSSSDWIWETDADLRFTYFSERAAELLGRSRESLIGKTREELVREGNAGALPDNWQAHLAGLTAHRAFRAFEYPLLGDDGSFRQIRVSGKPILASDGRFLGYRGTGTDVTDLVLAQKELLGAEKLAALGGMVAGIAHEINTPIGIGVTAASYLQEQAREFGKLYAAGQVKRADMEAHLRAIDETSASLVLNLQRAVGLVKSFKQIAVDESSDERRCFNLKEYIDEILDSLRPRLKRTEHLIEVRCPDELELDSYPGAFSQILTNLIINSLIHGFEHLAAGRIEIVAGRAGNELSLNYRDNGCGMDAEQVKRVFEPFFTTRRGRGGSGLGMHIVHNLVVKKLHGRIECRSAPGAGVEFSIAVPIDVAADHQHSSAA
ncbi:MAG: hypothetical protein A3H93_01745 [Rhodocyclales bacterium RIFCSPLOWO2_02_FULL_63_24]|nr:MAG: hypothetical protein A2040_07215 [Rhodocyclales bacterium GWA2_65_19]OHC68953.1 MAG: hypothetical protein A3H93_01745 [Rhodocyclales bacterium RIFCSPLOWO2_02_FULL_63_24]